MAMIKDQLNKTELNIKIQEVENKIKELRKIEGESDLSYRIDGLHSRYSYQYSRDPHFTGIILSYGSYRTIQKKIITFKNFDRDLEEKCKWLAEKLDDYVGHNKRQQESFKENLDKQNARAKTIHKNLEAYSDGKGLHGEIKLHNISFNYELRISNVSDELAKVILETIENYVEKDVK